MPVSRLDHAALRVLCVDDDELMLEFVTGVLSDCDFDVVSFHCPTAALKYLTAHSDVDVVISDVMMPEMSGPELYAACHRRSHELARRFLFVSADLTHARLLLDAAMREVGELESPTLLSKQFSRESLLAAVATVAASVRASCESQRSPARISSTGARDSRF